MSFNPTNNTQLSYNSKSGVLVANVIHARKKLIIGGDVWSNDAEAIRFNSPCVFNAGVTFATQEEDNVVSVGSPQYPTIQSAIDSFAGKNAGKSTIQIPAGCYDEYINLEGFSSSDNFQERDFTNGDALIATENRGLQILGDNRPFIPCKSYVNGYENAQASGRGLTYQITTTSPASGPYQAYIAESWGSIGSFSGGAQVAIPTGVPPDTNVTGLAGAPLTNVFLPNQLALIRRGTYGFATKAFHAQTGGGVGASAVIIFNNNPATGIPGMGGTNSAVTIPGYAVSNADGLALQALILANPGIQFNITPVDPVYSPPLGTNYAMTQLSLNLARDTLTVAMTGPLPVADDNILAPPVLVQPDFAHPLLELAVGDQIAFSQSGWNPSTYETPKSLHTITAFSGNTITFTPAVPAVVAGGVDVTMPGSSVTFLPNVCIRPSYVAGRTPTPTFASNGVSYAMSGIWVDTDASQPFNNVLEGFRLVDGVINASNLAVTDFANVSANVLGVHLLDSDVYQASGYRGGAGRIAIVGYTKGFGASSQAMLRGGSMFITNCAQLAFAASIGSSIGLENLQIMGSQGLFQADVGYGIGLGGGGNYAGVSMNVNKLLHIADIYGPGISINPGSSLVVNNPCVRVERCYFPAGGTSGAGGGISVAQGASMLINRGTYWADGSYRSQPRLSSNVSDCFDIFGLPDTYPNVGVFVENGGKFLCEGDLTFSGNDLDAQTVHTGEFSAVYAANSPNGVLQVSASGALNNAYLEQSLAVGSLAMTLDPTAVFASDELYVGKTYTLVSNNASAHTLTLLGGATFTGIGASGSVATFDPVVGASMVFNVVSPTSVLVLAKQNVQIPYVAILPPVLAPNPLGAVLLPGATNSNMQVLVPPGPGAPPLSPLCVVTYGNAYPAAPFVDMSPMSVDSAGLSGPTAPFVDFTLSVPTGFTLVAGPGGLPANAAPYVWSFSVSFG